VGYWLWKVGYWFERSVWRKVQGYWYRTVPVVEVSGVRVSSQSQYEKMCRLVRRPVL